MCSCLQAIQARHISQYFPILQSCKDPFPPIGFTEPSIYEGDKGGQERVLFPAKKEAFFTRGCRLDSTRNILSKFSHYGKKTGMRNMGTLVEKIGVPVPLLQTDSNDSKILLLQN